MDRMVGRYLAIFAALASPAAAVFTCLRQDGSSQDCSVNSEEGEPHVNICWAFFDPPKDPDTGALGNIQDKGCLEQRYFDTTPETFDSAPSCGTSQNYCFCDTSGCNTATWAIDTLTAYTPPPACYEGVIGANEGEQCSRNLLFNELEFESVNCGVRVYEGCRPNSKDGEMGVGCDDGWADKESCEGIQPDNKRDPSDTIDGSDRQCYWEPTRADKQGDCETDDNCDWNVDSEDGGSCMVSALHDERYSTWLAQRGMNCKDRIIRCWVDGSAYVDEGHWDGQSCTDIQNEKECSDRKQTTNCDVNDDVETCKKCAWTPLETPENMCLTNNAGTENVCEYNDGNGPPTIATVEMAFADNLIFRKERPFNGKCSLTASFRTGYGSAAVLGADDAGVIQQQCQNTHWWEHVGEYVNHTTATVDEYCTNFIPSAPTMASLANLSASVILAEVKAGNFATLFPDLANLRYIVTARDYGECLFTALSGQWGAAFCTCDTAGCNDMNAFAQILDEDTGPMRLLQFIDGSLSDLAAAINAVVPGLMDEEGLFVQEKTDDVTADLVDQLLLIPEVAALTNKDELWGVIQDYQTLNSYIALGGDPNDPPPGGLPGAPNNGNNGNDGAVVGNSGADVGNSGADVGNSGAEGRADVPAAQGWFVAASSLVVALAGI